MEIPVRIALVAAVLMAAIAPVSAVSPSPSYNLTGFAAQGPGPAVIGGGVISETDPGYRKVHTPLEFAQALLSANKNQGVKVIEIMNDLDLGWNEVGPEVRGMTSTPFTSAAAPKLHPVLKETGVSSITINPKNGGLTIFSANGSAIRHGSLNIKATKNIIIRNLKFDELWEWDEESKGDYDKNNWDFITLGVGGGTVDHVWVDHCTFTKAYDGIVDTKGGASNITYSWNKYAGDDGATNPNSFVRQQVNALEANKSSYPMYNFLRTRGYSVEDIVQIVQGPGKLHAIGELSLHPDNVNSTVTFHHQWYINAWDRLPRLAGGMVHSYNTYADATGVLEARRLRDDIAETLSPADQQTLNNTYNFQPPINGSISTENGSMLVEKSVYIDTNWPLRNNQTDPNNPVYTGKIKAEDTIYIYHEENGDITYVRGDSTDPGNPLGPFQAPIIPFSWNTPDGERPYPAPPMHDPSALEAIVTSSTAGAGAGVLNWEMSNWLKTMYELVAAALPGDYNENGVVDAADYIVWRDNVGAPAGSLPNDTAGGAIGTAQYNLWRSNYGATSPSPSSAAVPEPASLLLALLTIAAWCCRRSNMRTLAVTIVASIFVATSAASPASAQLVAFPGAEGVAKNITGGRGGDVYKVTNLNDAGAGSLRVGIQSAPSTGRTIVFDVAGTINLASSLDFNGKDNITIAGQTAPGGGITLAGNRLRINPLFNSDNVVDPISNVIVQFIRVRPGEAATNADGVWIQTASNVIIDHVTTSWAVDESISSTHDSNNVTVQWSTMSQGLFDHSYGSLLNGGTYTYAHNLYAHNKSRNPRLQQSQDLIMNLDFVNNVIYNPQDRFAYGGGEYNVNWVGNYGIRGPGTGDTNHAFARDTDTESRFYVEGNLMDNNTDGLPNGVVPVLEGDDHEASMFRQGESYTLLGSRVPVPAANVTTAQQAYVHVLSRAGATNFRDAHDRDMIRDVINQQPGFIASEDEWGPYPTLPTGSPAPDSNNDGVPDVWALANIGNASTPLNTTYAPSGYTYLEKYIHSLTPFAYAPAGTQSHTITTGYGRGGDAQVNENGGTSATSSGDGTWTTLNALWGGSSGSTNQAIVLKFDLSGIVPGSVNSAKLELTAAEAISGTHNFKVWGLEHNGADWNWDESTVEFDDAPGLVFDGNSRTLGIDPRYTADGQPAEQSNQPLDYPGLYLLGEFSIGSMSAGQTASFDSLNLAVMLNLAAYFEGQPHADVVTLILEQTNASGSNDATFYSQEGSASLAPRLVVDAVLTALNPPALPGDYNGDDVVNAADYVVWRNSENTSVVAYSGADGNGSGYIDADDYAVWRSNFGEAIGSGGLTSDVVPEPSSICLLLIAVVLGLMRRRSQPVGHKPRHVRHAYLMPDFTARRSQ